MLGENINQSLNALQSNIYEVAREDQTSVDFLNDSQQMYQEGWESQADKTPSEVQRENDRNRF